MLALGLVAGCAGPPHGPFFDDQRHLVFGVDPDAEAAAVVERFEAVGRRVLLRVRGRHFTALGFDDGHGHAAAVRVVTVRGIALALDPPEADGLHDPVAFALLAPPIEGTHDADADGFEEVFVERREGGARQGCIQPYRVRDVGFVDAVAVELGALTGWGCIEALKDLQHDGHVDPWLVLRRDPRADAAPLSVGLPLVVDRHGFAVRLGEPVVTQALAAQRGERELGLADASAHGDSDRAARLERELALIGRLLGETETAPPTVEPVPAASTPDAAPERVPAKAGK